jgi:hypothetical protein
MRSRSAKGLFLEQPSRQQWPSFEKSLVSDSVTTEGPAPPGERIVSKRASTSALVSRADTIGRSPRGAGCLTGVPSSTVRGRAAAQGFVQRAPRRSRSPARSWPSAAGAACWRAWTRILRPLDHARRHRDRPLRVVMCAGKLHPCGDAHPVMIHFVGFMTAPSRCA